MGTQKLRKSIFTIGLHQDLKNNNKTPSLKSNKTYSNLRWIIGVAALLMVFFTGLFFVLNNDGLKDNNAFAEVIAFDGLVEGEILYQ